MEQRRLAPNIEPVRGSHLVERELGFGALQRPRLMMHLGAEDHSARPLRVEAVALGEKMLEASGRGFTGLGDRFVGGGKTHPAVLRSLAPVGDRMVIGPALHPRVE